MSILKWQKNDLAMTQEVITPECVFLCRQGRGREHILEYVLVVELGLSTKGEVLKKKKIFKGSIIVLIAQTEKCNERSR